MLPLAVVILHTQLLLLLFANYLFAFSTRWHQVEHLQTLAGQRERAPLLHRNATHPNRPHLNFPSRPRGSLPGRREASPPAEQPVTACDAAGTHAGVVLQLRQQLFGRQQEMEETAEGVAAVTVLCHAEDLAAERGGGALAGRVEGGQCGVDAALQRFRVLQGKQSGCGGWEASLQ